MASTENRKPTQEEYELTITTDGISSTDERFTINNIVIGDKCKPLDAYFIKANGDVIRRNYGKGERRISNQTLPRLAFQLYEKQIAGLSVEERENWPVCQYTPNDAVIRGIYPSTDAIKKARNTSSYEYLVYNYGEGRQFVIYSWNIFSTLLFVQECIKQFGEPGDQFKLIYRDKEEKDDEAVHSTETVEENTPSGTQPHGYRNIYTPLLLESKNIIFRGAPGTGKSYLAKEIATDIVSNGYYDSYTSLSDEQKKQIEFVQFHPSYDYTDFVEGLRPRINDDGTVGFELKDGIFKSFVARARKNYEDSLKSEDAIGMELTVEQAMNDFFSSDDLSSRVFRTITGNEFTITSVSDEHIYISIPGNAMTSKLSLSMDEIRKMLESGQKFTKIKDITTFFGKTFATQAYSYDYAIYQQIKPKIGSSKKAAAKPGELKKYIFIIDEINRGEISKIFGELFFAIDPGYRGKAGEVSTQYASLHNDSNEKFYIPENVYIIGTMNDIDRSVDSFDFAMRRRFRFIELKADKHTGMLENLEDEALREDAINRMTALNREISSTPELNDNYQIGAAYFLKLKTLSPDQLWKDYLEPLLQEYVTGMNDEEGIMKRFANAYGYHEPANGETDEVPQN